ncbi:hypothetical protein EXIGLDRAFT_758349 [Exidia glandulosa HHB12029]|uniref:Uncharacterized protein n=1 Tax=Exidia glandulosa HHB12029 TaxID=1314781 RepID=A0A165QTE4_EXIGL|nr:hypothetical protein EXIGLDRAFT_758349 [Exidia glandulosa HHB12029]
MWRLSRAASRAILAHTPTLPATVSRARLLSSTRPTGAAEDPSSFIANFKHSPLFRQLADKPEALQALSELAELIKSKGWNLKSNEAPSPITIMRIVSDKEFRAAASKVIDELQKAGVDFKPENALELLTGQSSKDDGGEKKS